MIPKIIHYCWLSDDPLPPKLQACIDSWSVHCPDYEIRLWNFDRLGSECPLWVRQAFEAKKYAFAADWVRAYALYHFGGIYLDSDVELLGSFDKFLNRPYMLGRESGGSTVEAAVMGAEAGHPFFKALLDYYDGRQFVKADGSLDILDLPRIINKVSADRFILRDIASPEEFRAEEGTLCVLPEDYFSPINLQNMKLTLTPRTVSIHHFAGSWKPARYRWKKRLQQLLGPRITMLIIHLKDIVLNRK